MAVAYETPSERRRIFAESYHRNLAMATELEDEYDRQPERESRYLGAASFALYLSSWATAKEFATEGLKGSGVPEDFADGLRDVIRQADEMIERQKERFGETP